MSHDSGPSDVTTSRSAVESSKLICSPDVFEPPVKPLPPGALNWALRLRGCEEQKIGESYRGYCNTEAELEAVLLLHKQQTRAVFGTRQSPSPAKPATRLMWKSQYVPYDGIPFAIQIQPALCPVEDTAQPTPPPPPEAPPQPVLLSPSQFLQSSGSAGESISLCDPPDPARHEPAAEGGITQILLEDGQAIPVQIVDPASTVLSITGARESILSEIRSVVFKPIRVQLLWRWYLKEEQFSGCEVAVGKWASPARIPF
ncbi:unnamed protein product [Leuciscus chuanchicus]